MQRRQLYFSSDLLDEANTLIQKHQQTNESIGELFYRALQALDTATPQPQPDEAEYVQMYVQAVPAHEQECGECGGTIPANATARTGLNGHGAAMEWLHEACWLREYTE